MDAILHSLQGHYGYLLAAQVLIVAGLMLTFIWLLVRRVIEKSAAVEAIAGASMETQVLAGPSSEETEQLHAELSQAQQDLARVSGEKKELGDKIKYLESELLEYEILQEEIGTLSALKLENEQLRENLVRLEGKVSASPQANSTPPPPTEITPSPSDEPEESPAEAALKQAATEQKEATPDAVTEEKNDAGEALEGIGGLIEQIGNLAEPPSDSDTPAEKKKKAS